MVKMGVTVALVLAAARDALACPVCFGASDAPMALGMNWGVLTLLGVTLGVLGSFAVLFVRVVRRSEQEIGPAKAGPHVWTEAGPHVWTEAGPHVWTEASPHVWPEEGNRA